MWLLRLRIKHCRATDSAWIVPTPVHRAKREAELQKSESRKGSLDIQVGSPSALSHMVGVGLAALRLDSAAVPGQSCRECACSVIACIHQKEEIWTCSLPPRNAALQKSMGSGAHTLTTAKSIKSPSGDTAPNPLGNPAEKNIFGAADGTHEKGW
jgi:hypothetical protein